MQEQCKQDIGITKKEQAAVLQCPKKILKKRSSANF